MSWLARSIANTLRLDDDEDDDGDGDNNGDDSDCDNVDLRDDDVCNPRYGVVDHASSSLLHPSESYDLEEVDLEDRIDVINGNSDNNNRDSERNGDYCNNQGRGVRDDLSEFRETLTRQFWGVASLLAPPPPPPPLPPPPFPARNASWMGLDRERRVGLEGTSFEKEEVDARDEQFGEVQRDFVEMEAAMEEDEEEEEEDLVGEAVGITEEVLAFAQNIAHHPETWLDFPLSEEEDFDGNLPLQLLSELNTF